MHWFRPHLQTIARLALTAWLLAFGVAVSQGCLAQVGQGAAAAHAIGAGHADNADQAGAACQKHCADTALALSPALGLPAFDTPGWAILLLCPSLGSFASRFILPHRLAPPPPARLRFVRFND